jgi:hypothetical protein
MVLALHTSPLAISQKRQIQGAGVFMNEAYPCTPQSIKMNGNEEGVLLGHR